MSICEDAPCCGCCGTDIYGTSQSGPDDPEWYYCDCCGYNHSGPCPYDDPDYDEDYVVEDDPDFVEAERPYVSYRMEM